MTAMTKASNVRTEGTRVTWTVDGERLLRISRPRPGTWRLQMADTSGTFDDRGACQLLAAELNEPLREDPATIALGRDDAGNCRLTAGAAGPTVVLEEAPFRLGFRDADGRLRLAIDLLGNQDGSIHVSGPLGEGERLYGTGERFNAVDQRGREVEIWAEDRWCETEGNSYLPIPFVLSTGGYAWLVNRFEGMQLDLGAAEPGRWSISAIRAPLDLYVFVDDDPRTILGSLAALTGHAPVPPEWAFGMLVSRHGRTKEFATPEGVLEMARRMKELDLPWSAVILEGWPTFDTKRYDELRELADALHAAGKKVMVYEACGRVRANLCDGVKDSTRYCIRTRDDSVDLEETRGFNPADAPNRSRSRWVDITDPEAWNWWCETVWGPLLDTIGIDGAKIDFCEQVPENEDLVPGDGRSPRGMHHYYPTRYNTLMYRLFNAKRPEGGVCWSRGGGIGAALYPWAWCGDQRREWGFLAAILKAALSAGLSGVPFMGHDLGGYMPAKDPEACPEPEVFARGCALACFNPMMSTHGTVTRPYDFDPDIVDVYRLFSKIHYALIPYLIEQARAGCAAGLPMMRHLVLHHPADERAVDCEDQFYLGEDLLVAPVLTGGVARPVYLPEGDWEELFAGTRHSGPGDLDAFPAPLDRIPVFVRQPVSSKVLPEIVGEVRRLVSAVSGG